MLKRIGIVITILLATCLLASQAGEQKRFAFIFKSTGNPFGEKLMEGFKTAVEEQGHTAILRAPDLPTAEGQISIIEELIAQRVAGIGISANDPDALQPVLERARRAGIKIVTADSATNAESRDVHINQADPELIGRVQVQAAFDMAGGKGDIAVLSATSQATNQNIWINWMQEELKLPKYSNTKLVKVAYGDDLRDKSTSETEALLQTFPNLKAIIAPTTVGIAAAGKVLSDKNLAGKVFLTGLGLPSEMAEYINNDVCPWMYLWNPIDLGYLAGYASVALADNSLKATPGSSFSAGHLSKKEVINASDGGTEIMLGAPFKFDKANINEWKTVY
ncbi:MAG: rhamnose ABC transporter substrate-binding protein [Planctomycetota bacterium]|jgi:rhamnose transport system substrate-binding protein|nr:rhamnose ABC transporter substrate-binding protein [Planctomycetota bacterium]